MHWNAKEQQQGEGTSAQLVIFLPKNRIAIQVDRKYTEVRSQQK